MTEHVLVRDAQRLTANPDAHARVAVVAAAVEGAVAAALTCVDPDEARDALPRAVRELHLMLQPLIGGGLVNGTAWRDEQHRRLFLHAQQVLGPEAAQIVQRPTTEPLDGPGARGGPRSMFGI